MRASLLFSRTTLGLLALLLFGSAEGLAQVQLSTSGTPPGAVFRYAEPGRSVVEVRVWGGVRTPGLYLVEPDTDLLELLTLAGGPQLPVEDERYRREVTVQLIRGQGGNRQVVLDRELETLAATPAEYPNLEDGDIVAVEVETRAKFGWRDALSIITSVGSLAVIVLNIVRFTE